MRRAASGIAICWKFQPLSRETNKPSSVPMKIAPGSLAFVTSALTLICAGRLPPVPLIALETLISLQPFFSSSVMNNPFHVEAISQFDVANEAECGCESPAPIFGPLLEPLFGSLFGMGAMGVKGKIAKT